MSGERRHGRGRSALASRAEAHVAVPVEELWAEIARPGHLVDDHPYIAGHEVERWPGVGARDHLTYLSGLRMQRDITAWHEGVGYDLVIARTGRAGAEKRVDARVTWRVRAAGEAGSVLAIEITPEVGSVLRGIPAPLRTVAYATRGRRLMQSYVDAVVAGVRHHLEEGQPVPRDAPRPHPWFSRRDATTTRRRPGRRGS